MSFPTPLFAALLLCSLGLSTAANATARKSRNYDGSSFYFPDNYLDASAEDTDKPLYTDAGTTTSAADPSRWDGTVPTHPKFYKGYPYYAPDWKGALDAPQDEMVEKMVTMNAMSKLQSLSPKREEKGLLATLLGDPKYVLMAALVPLSIMLASFIPILANFFANATNSPSLPSVISTLASGRLARAFDDQEAMARIMEAVLELGAKAMEDGECFRKVVCETALEQGGAENVQAAAGVLGTFAKQSWLTSMGVEDIVKALEKGNCKNLCGQSNINGIDLRY